MTVIRRPPYLTPSQDRLRIGDWSLVRDETTVPMEELLPDWDAAVNISAVIPVELDVQGIFQDCHLDKDARLRLASVWESQGTMLRGRGAVIDFDSEYPVEQIDLWLQVEGICLAKKLDLSVNLVLLYSGTNAHPLTPKIPGSILAQKTQTVLLEGEGARFPTEVINFAEGHYPSDAGWALYWDPDDLHQTVLGDIRLYINMRHERIMRAVSQNLPEDYGIREAIRLDLARTLIYGALNNPEFVENSDQFAQGTIGAAVRNMLRLYFPQISFTQLRDNSRQPQSFEPKLQEKFRSFWEE